MTLLSRVLARHIAGFNSWLAQRIFSYKIIINYIVVGIKHRISNMNGLSKTVCQENNMLLLCIADDENVKKDHEARKQEMIQEAQTQLVVVSEIYEYFFTTKNNTNNPKRYDKRKSSITKRCGLYHRRNAKCLVLVNGNGQT